jgi:hypothetical protein
MPTIKELGAQIGDQIEYWTSVPRANYGPSYSATSHRATIVAIRDAAVFVHPPHLNNLGTWRVQDLKTGEIRKDNELITFNLEKGDYEIPYVLEPSRERFVDFLIATDRRRFKPETLGQRLRDMALNTKYEAEILFDHLKAAW